MSSSFEIQSSNGSERPNIAETPVDPLASTDSQKVYSSEGHPDHKRAELRTADWSAPDHHAANGSGEPVEPLRVNSVRMPDAPLRIVLARRARSIAHGTRAFVTEYPWISLAAATGAGIVVGRALPSSIQRKIGLGVVTFVGRRVIRAMSRAIERSVPEDA